MKVLTGLNEKSGLQVERYDEVREKGKVIIGMVGEQACLASPVRVEGRAGVSAATVVVRLVRFGSKTYRNLPGSSQL